LPATVSNVLSIKIISSFKVMCITFIIHTYLYIILNSFNIKFLTYKSRSPNSQISFLPNCVVGIKKTKQCIFNFNKTILNKRYSNQFYFFGHTSMWRLFNVSVTIVLMVMLMLVLARMLIFRTLVKRSTVHNNGDGDVKDELE
jgi:hypothetical protein